jgi:Fe-S-cluster containining protein
MKRKTEKDIFQRLAMTDRRALDELFHQTHDEVFSDFDCLSCANCCKSIPPRLRDADIRRIAAHLHMKPSAFAEKYIRTDDDGDYVFNSTPCPFLEADNTCRIYEHRPLACAEYPHTDRPRMYQILELTRKNTKVCPAVRDIMQRIENTLSAQQGTRK